MTQEQIWEKYVEKLTVDDIVKQYKNPSIFQKELVCLINQENDTNKYIIEIGCEGG